jgi:putative transposase
MSGMTGTESVAYPSRWIREGEALLAALESEKTELDSPTRRLRAAGSARALPLLAPAKAPALTDSVRLLAAPKRSDDPVQYAIDQYLEDGSSLEALLLTLYYGEISISKAATVLKSLWGLDAGLGFLAEQVPLIEQRISDWLGRSICARLPYVFLKSMVLKTNKSRKAEARLLLAIGVGETGYREVLSVRVSSVLDDLAWPHLLADLKSRGLTGIELFVGDNCPTIAGAVRRHFPGAPYQGNLPQLGRDILNLVSVGNVYEIMVMLEAIGECTDAEKGRRLLAGLANALERQGSWEAAHLLKVAAPFQFRFSCFPAAHWTRLRDNGQFIRMMHDFRNWLRIGTKCLDNRSLQIVASAQLRHVSRVWARKKFLRFPHGPS